MNKLYAIAVLIFISFSVMAQSTLPSYIKNGLPRGTQVLENISYNNGKNPKQVLDLYIPAKSGKDIPLIVLVHGGGWISNNKHTPFGFMMNTVKDLLDNGFAIASIDYRYAQDAVFPLIIQDCNLAVSYLYDNAEKYNLDFDKVGLMGFSAGGHLASLMGTSQNNIVENFYVDGTYRSFEYRGVVDFYGPIDLTKFPGSNSPTSPEGTLIGAAPLARPDLAKAASPLTYLDKNDPPYIIFHGEKDNTVPNEQSKIFSKALTEIGVDNKLTIVKNAPHFGRMYDVKEIRSDVIEFLKRNLD